MSLMGYNQVKMKMKIKNLFILFVILAMTSNALNAQESGRKTQSFSVNGVSFEMVYVAGSTFQFSGKTELVKSFYIGETEVTQELWEAVMGKNPSFFKGNQLDFHWGKENNLNRPVEKVSWNDCQTFIQKLNELTGREFRLPSFVEWKYAAFGGRDSKQYLYAGGNDINEVAWYSKNSGYSEITKEIGLSSRTQQVKQKQPNELGIYDMSGNVKEWVQDNEDGYSVALGGGYDDNGECLLGTTDYKAQKCTYTGMETGLRIALSGTD